MILTHVMMQMESCDGLQLRGVLRLAEALTEIDDTLQPSRVADTMTTVFNAVHESRQVQYSMVVTVEAGPAWQSLSLHKCDTVLDGDRGQPGLHSQDWRQECCSRRVAEGGEATTSYWDPKLLLLHPPFA